MSFENTLTRTDLLQRAGAAGLLVASGGLLATGGRASAAVIPARATKDLVKITVVAEWLLWAAHAPVVAAINEGYFRRLGLDVNYIAPPNPGDQMKFVAGGRSQISLTQTPDVIRARGAGIPVKIVGRLWSGQPTGILSLPESGIKGPKDLIGKTIGLAQTPDHLGGFHTIMTKAGADASKVKVVDKGYAGVELLMSKKVDAIYSVLGGEYSVVRLLIKKKPNFMFSTDYGVPNYPLLIWFSTDSYIKKHPDVIKAFLKGTQLGARAVIQAKPVLKRAMAKIESSNKVFKPDQHQAGLDDIKSLFTTNTSVSPAIIDATVKWMRSVIVKGSPWLPASQVKPSSQYLG
jgi:ABC-type nitrate/sulfonate/bicarbonate transport system substrate-binding protein